MYRIFFRSLTLWGTVGAVLLMSGCRGESVKVDILHSDTSLLSSAPIIEILEGPEFDKDWIFGGIITTNGISSALESIPEPEKYKTVAILADTNHSSDTHKIFTYSDPGVLKNATFDRETIQKLQEANIVASLGAVPQESFWNKPFINELTEHFPDSKFILLSLNKSLATPEAAGYALKSHLPEESIVFALADFEPNQNQLIHEFQKNYTHEILSQFDETHFKDLPLEETVPLEVIGRYLRLQGATKSREIGEKQFLFQKGEKVNEPSTVYMVSFGDIMLGRFVRVLMDSNGLEYPFEKMDNDYLRVNDLLLANLEGPITNSAVRSSTGMSFGFFPDVAPILKKYHFDLLSQANNHSLDKRIAGYEESLEFIRGAGIIPFGRQHGIGKKSVAYSHIRGQKFAFFGLEDVNSPINEQQALATVKNLVSQEYKVIVYPHWGIEYQNRPNDRQRGLAHSWIDAGAYAVIGHHPHVIQTYETYNRHPIFYSLGNAVFDQYWSIPTQEGLSIALAMNGEHITIYFLPIKIDRSQMRLMNPDEARAQLKKLVQWGDHSEEERQAILSGKLIL